MRLRIPFLATVLALAAAGCGSGALEPATPPVGTPADTQAAGTPPKTAATRRPTKIPATRRPAKTAATADDLASVVAQAWAWTPKAADPTKVVVTIDYDDGWVSGLTNDRDVRVGERKLKLSERRRWRRRPNEEVEPAEGLPVAGGARGLDEVDLIVGGRQVHVDLTQVTNVVFEASSELARAPGLDELKNGRFIRPFYSKTPVTSFRTLFPLPGPSRNPRPATEVSASGNDLFIQWIWIYDQTHVLQISLAPNVYHAITQPQAKAYIKIASINLNFDYTHRDNAFCETGKVCEFPAGRGKYVIWELERTSASMGPTRKADADYYGRYYRLAIDYDDREYGPGMIRLNSSFR